MFEELVEMFGTNKPSLQEVNHHLNIIERGIDSGTKDEMYLNLHRELKKLYEKKKVEFHNQLQQLKIGDKFKLRYNTHRDDYRTVESVIFSDDDWFIDVNGNKYFYNGQMYEVTETCHDIVEIIHV